MFSDSYRSIFATLGVPLHSHDACTKGEIENAERRLGLKLPESLKEYYLVAGLEKRVNQIHDRLLPTDKMFVDSERVVFMEENQQVVYWGVAEAAGMTRDAAVFQGVNRSGKSIEWHAEHHSCCTFLNVMAIWHASFGGAAENTAVGYVDEASTRAGLDAEWELVGEVNAMRAYKQADRAVCFLKWEDFFQKKRNLPPWRLFAAAVSAEALDELKASLKAQWE